MKNFILGLLLFPISLTAQDKFSIAGKIQGLPEGSSVTVSDINNPTDTLARSSVKSGSFELTGTVKEPNLLQLNFNGVKKKSVVFIGNEKVQLSGNADAIPEINLKGSSIHDDFEQFKKTFNPLFGKLGELGQKINSSAVKNDSLNTAYEAGIARIKTEVDNFIKTKPASPVSPFVVIVTSEIEQDAAIMERRYAALDKKVQTGFYGNLIKQQIDDGKTGSIGSEAIDFSQADTAGQQIKLSSFRGKYVLVDFWASWCRPCRDENPNLVNAFNKYSRRNFTVLGVSLDNNKNQWLKAIAVDKLAWTQLSDLKGWTNEVAAKYKIQSIPQNLLIDPNGKIIAKNLRGPELHSALEKLLK